MILGCPCQTRQWQDELAQVLKMNKSRLIQLVWIRMISYQKHSTTFILQWIYSFSITIFPIASLGFSLGLTTNSSPALYWPRPLIHHICYKGTLPSPCHWSKHQYSISSPTNSPNAQTSIWNNICVSLLTITRMIGTNGYHCPSTCWVPGTTWQQRRLPSNLSWNIYHRSTKQKELQHHLP